MKKTPVILKISATAAIASIAFLAACGQKTDAGSSTNSNTAAAPAAPAGAEKIQIAVVSPLTGGIAHIGKDVANGVRLAVDEINAGKPTIGGKTVVFEVMSEDDGGDPKQATAIAQRLCDKKVAAVVGHLQSGTSIPASTIYNKCGIAQITPAATNPAYTANGYNNVFRLIANDNQLVAGVAETAVKKMGIKTVAIVDDRTAYGQGLAKVFAEVAAKNGVQVVASEFTNDKASDFMAILTSIKSKNPDAILFGGLDAQAGPMLRQMEQLGMTKTRLVGGDAICTEKLPELAGGVKSVENAVCATGGADIAKLPGGKEWLERYNKQYPGEFQIYGAYAYAAAKVFAEAMKQANSAAPKDFLPKLAAINYDGLTGNVSFTPVGELTNPTISFYTYRDGKRVDLP